MTVCFLGDDMITKERRDNHLFVYYNGQLFFKVWYPSGRWIINDPYGPAWSLSDRPDTSVKDVPNNP